MDAAALLDDLHRPPPFFPVAALRAAARQQSEITPALLELLAARADAAVTAETEDLAWLYALSISETPCRNGINNLVPGK
jgi:hypothetical protein